ncbi:zf-CSL-domain-containing protein [Daedalea quercina L-15889]|uniref:Diphthamide biosynthesis protein 3 n=1 Tax=Daedalea quercina L-15889 TaxID=1314783 RepID=A0A165N4B1_9APHY|nr:zf-CSL-domain-containing protein [Daedalea quercina L-15889]
MGAYYDEVEIEDMAWDEEKRVYHYPCPCGDRFEISRKQLANYEDIATCPSCSLVIRVIYDPLDYEDEPSDDEEGAAEESSGEEGSGSDGDEFKDALDRLTIADEQPRAIAVAA